MKYYFEEFSSRSEAFRKEMQCKSEKIRKKTIDKLILGFPKRKMSRVSAEGGSAPGGQFADGFAYDLCSFTSFAP